MRLSRVVMVTAGAAFVLASCSGGDNFHTLGEKFKNRSGAGESYAAATSATPPTGPFQKAAYDGYVAHAKYEYENMQDYTDTIFHAQRASAVAGGQTVVPQPTSERVLTPEHAAELSEARARYMAVAEGEPGQRLPAVAGRTMADYDCWIEQQEENFQPDDIAACRDAFYAGLAELEAPVVEEVDVISLSSDVLFEFDKSDIRPEFTGELDAAADTLLSNPDVTIRIDGHTDSVGTEEYNQGLSERRAESVAAYLEAAGVARDRMTVAGFGESQPVASNDTAEGRALNRRVDIDLIQVGD